ncbi:hypothetical protein C0J52_12310 [Blattella germanica]|nr:hypothetical protein C0J52_12310 [Blattella germanica]
MQKTIRNENIAAVINRLKREINQAVRDLRAKTWHNMLDTHNIHELWKITKALTSRSNDIPSLTIDAEKSNTFADFLENVFTPNVEPSNAASNPETEDIAGNLLNQVPTKMIRQTNSHKIKRIIKHMKNRKA